MTKDDLDQPAINTIRTLSIDALRAIPGLVVLRPGDANEVVAAHRHVLQLRHRPAVIALSRQGSILGWERYVGAAGRVIGMQPDEGIALEFAAKRPGPQVELGTVCMKFAYQDYFEKAPSTGYETLLYDCMIGDATLFQRADNVEAGWQAVQPVLEAWADQSPNGFPNYEAGSDGPSAAAELPARDGNAWRPLVP